MNNNDYEESELGTEQDKKVILATISSFDSGTLTRYVARVLVPGRPAIVLRPYPNPHAAILRLHTRWPDAVVVDQDVFARLERKQESPVPGTDSCNDRDKVNG